MAFDSRAIANYFLERAQAEGRELTAMQVIKLVYFAHGWNLALRGAPLITDPVEAWDYGPVIRPVYDAFKRFGNKPIDEFAYSEEPYGLLPGRPFSAAFSQGDVELLDKVWQVYGRMSGFQLSNRTHQPGTPWADTYVKGVSSIIPDSAIETYFKNLATKNAARRQSAGPA